MYKRILTLIIFGVLVLAIISMPRAWRKIQRDFVIAEQAKVQIPEPSSVFSSSVFSVPPRSLRTSLNYDVPFTVQAPLAVWDPLHEEACEEASVLMVLRFFAGKKIASPEEAEEEIQRLVAKNTALGFPVDDTVEQVAELLRSEDASLNIRLIDHPSIHDLQLALQEGNLVIVPAQGQFLGNPFFTHPGPRYHMLVLKGYTENGYFITNDPGTKRGANYVYRMDVLMNAIHDWNDGDVENGVPRVVVVGR